MESAYNAKCKVQNIKYNIQNEKCKKQNIKYNIHAKCKCKMQKAAHRIGMLYCEISKEKDPWESKMQNAKSRKGVLCCASGKERDPRDNGHYY